jgi:hypothetical protein
MKRAPLKQANLPGTPENIFQVEGRLSTTDYEHSLLELERYLIEKPQYRRGLGPVFIS